MIVAELSLSLRGSTLLAILLVLIGIASAFAYYRFTLPPLPPRRRLILSLLRSISLSLLLLLFFEPIVRLIHRDEQPPRVAVLIDDSQSMTVKDKNGDRAAIVKKWLHDDGLKKIPGPATAEFSTFASKLRAGGASVPESLAFGGETTDLSSTFSQLKERIARENIQAAVVITDGDYTVGKNPVYDAASLGIPIYTIGVGDTNEQKDLLIEKVITNNTVYAETKVPVQVTMRSSGFNGENVDVSISEGKTILDHKVVQLAQGTREYPVELSVTPKEEGVKKYSVTVSSLPGELTEKNNSHTLFMKVLKSKLKIVLFAGAPNADVPAIRQALLEDGRFSLDVFVQKTSYDFYEGKFSASVLDSADCFIFVDFPSALTAGSIIQQVKASVDRAKKPLLFVAGTAIDYNKLGQFESILPVSWSGATAGEILVFASPVERVKNHPLITLEGEMTFENWGELPPINKSNIAFRSKPEAEMLCAVQFQGMIIPEPLIVIRSANHQRSMAITGENIWQWRLMAQGNARTEKFFNLFMANSVRWLTTDDEGKKVRIAPDKQIFTTAETVTMTGQIYDEQMQPIDDAEVNVEIRKGNEISHLVLQAAGNGVYQGALDGLGEGDYSYSGTVNVGSKQYGEDAGKFSVGSVNVEFLETKMNKELLEQIAYKTQGRYYDIAASGNLSEDLSRDVRFTQKELVQASEIELWNWQYFLAALVFLFALEWFIRKVNGML